MEWLQKSGKAQTEFMRGFGAAMAGAREGQDPAGPLKAMREMTGRAAEAQTDIAKSLGSLQAQGLDKMMNIGQMLMMMPNFLNWGAYKTSVGSNGRISIPEAERDALRLSEGDLVQVVVLPIAKRSQTKKEVKQ